jgi:glycosyltransferase involved in cell wall biosynthesis
MVLAVIRAVPGEVERIYVVDDACPDGTAALIADAIADPRIALLRNPKNLGVGGAVKRGYRAAMTDGADIVVKLDGDGQMDPSFIPRLVAPIAAGEADYAKGNRFARRHLMPAAAAGGRRMPALRRVGNSLASFFHKGVTGQWGVIDPANGYTAIHRGALEAIDLEAASDCYFFETDMLFQLGLAGAVVKDVPLPAHYAGEVSSLKVRNVATRFPGLALHRFLKRIALRYFLDDFNVASMQMLVGLPLLLIGTALGFYHWLGALESGVAASAGTVMFAALPIILGFQLLLAAVSYDVASRPAAPLSRRPPGE